MVSCIPKSLSGLSLLTTPEMLDALRRTHRSRQTDRLMKIPCEQNAVAAMEGNVAFRPRVDSVHSRASDPLQLT